MCARHAPTCLASTAALNSAPNCRSVMATSFKLMLKSRARSLRLRMMRMDTWSRWVMSWGALYSAMTCFSTSFTMLGSTFSS